MRVYIASNFADKDRVKERGEELKALGIECTSRWASESAPHNCKITDKPAQYMRETAVFDVEDIVSSDILVITSPSDAEMVNMTPHQMSRGGRHFEEGLMYGLMMRDQWQRIKLARQLIVLGRSENVFHFLDGTDTASKYPAVVVKQTWEEVKSYLVSQLGGTGRYYNVGF
jgi:hypothetical protein